MALEELTLMMSMEDATMRGPRGPDESGRRLAAVRLCTTLPEKRINMAAGGTRVGGRLNMTGHDSDRRWTSCVATVDPQCV
jgi:hypothetical protein